MMYALISPAKTMDFAKAQSMIERAGLELDAPLFAKETAEILKTLKTYNVPDLGKLLSVSDKLAQLNATRMAEFKQAPQAASVLAYRGDTYVGFNADQLNNAQLQHAHKMVGILSGFYGLVRPLDAIKPYRLEMSTNLSIGKYKNLYDFWGSKITAAINAQLNAIKAHAVVCLASAEYAKAVDVAKLNVPFIMCDFKEHKNGKLQTVGLLAKRARGSMANYMVVAKPKTPNDLKLFNIGGYVFDQALSNDKHFVFVR